MYTGRSGTRSTLLIPRESTVSLSTGGGGGDWDSSTRSSFPPRSQERTSRSRTVKSGSGLRVDTQSASFSAGMHLQINECLDCCRIISSSSRGSVCRRGNPQKWDILLSVPLSTIGAEKERGCARSQGLLHVARIRRRSNATEALTEHCCRKISKQSWWTRVNSGEVAHFLQSGWRHNSRPLTLAMICPSGGKGKGSV